MSPAPKLWGQTAEIFVFLWYIMGQKGDNKVRRGMLVTE